MNKPNNCIATYSALANLVSYNPDTGVFTWLHRAGEDRFTKRWNTCFSGKECGSLDKAGYKRIKFLFCQRQMNISAHRLAWFIHYGSLPNDEIDHVNRAKSDNRIANLREATRSENLRNFPLRKNNKSGVCGVHFFKKSNKWRAVAQVNNKRVSLGLYKNIEDAKEVVKQFQQKNGFSDMHGQAAA